MIVPTHVRTLEELGQLTAAILRGESAVELIGGVIEDETAAIASTLATYNESGYVTICSQPADTSARAFVIGYCDEGTAHLIQQATIGTDLVAVLHPPGQENWASILVGLAPLPEDPDLNLGRACPEGDRELLSGLLSPEAGQAVTDAWHVEVFDPKWGRDDLLWTTLQTALEGEK